MQENELELMLKGYGLTTARILYFMPDHRNILQTFIWQEFDIAPKFPRLSRFLEFWERDLDGPLHSVEFTHRRLIAPQEWRYAQGIFAIN